ncbi:MAG: hypothetical protein JW891_14730, partial [Candidatus Lokiarchaeota archaeon]|nr:hypothetical protein [Candidatus Lokiarchaeota archaeon]
MQKVLIKQRIPEKLELKLVNEIRNYLCSKGEIKACLLHKLYKYLFNKGIILDNNKEMLIITLIRMFEQGEIEIIIPRPYTLLWKKRKFNKLKFLQSGYYYFRAYREWPEKIAPPLNYLFDSRKFNLNDEKKN